MERIATWENIGANVVGERNVNDVLKKAKLDYTVEKQSVITSGGIILPDYMATVKDNGEACGIVSANYEICQNQDAFSFVDCMSDEIKFEKAGETKTGMVYIIASLPTVNILGDDFTPYVLFQNSHNGRYSVRACITPLRIVCQNQMALSFKNARNTISIKHNRLLADRMSAAEDVLLESANYIQELGKQAEMYAGIKLTKSQLDAVIKDFFPIKDDMTDRQKNTVLESRAQFVAAHNYEDNQNFKNTIWCAINAYSDYLTHREVKKTVNAEENKFMAVTVNPDFAKFIQLAMSVAA